MQFKKSDMTDQMTIPQQQLPENCRQKIFRLIHNEGFISYDMTNTIITGKVNYMGFLHEVLVRGKTKDGYKELCLFIKLPRPTSIVFFTAELAFDRESYAYLELFKIYEVFQRNFNVPEDERFKTVKCFDGTDSKAIILENLSRKGFKTLPRMEVVPLIFAELSIEQLAKFHALSVVLQNQRPEYFYSKVVPLDYTLSIKSDEHDSVMKDLLNTSKKYLSKESLKQISTLIDTAKEEVNKHLTISRRFKCLCRGDFKTDNVLCRIQDQSIQEVVMIDHQAIHYGSPFNDFTYFILTETDREFRRKYLNHLKNFYYSRFEKFLSYFAMDLNCMWSREEFENEFEESLNFVVIRCMMLFPLIFAEENDIPYFDKDLATMDRKQDSRIRDRVQGVVDDFLGWRGISAKTGSS